MFLGEILSGITGKNMRCAQRTAEERVSLIPDTANLSDPFAIRVQDENRQSLGYLSHSTAKWLSPLLKAGKVRAEARIPPRSGFAQSLKPSSIPLLISLFRASPMENFWEIEGIESRKDVLHQLVCRAYQIAQDYREPTCAAYLSEGLRSLSKQNLHPQTQFLLALLAEMGRKKGG
ncbi:MAG: HIRAN domain-containing protein [Pirellulales bacterium]|nr:HIRAN domain-containing protein [Pirellulales bacterium]